MNIQSAENALKTVYLSVLTEQLNNAHPLLSAIRHTSQNVWGKDIQVYTGSGLLITAPLCNLYGIIEISDKVLRCASSNLSYLVNLLNSEIELLLCNAKKNVSEKLFKSGDGFIGLDAIFDLSKPLYGLQRDTELMVSHCKTDFGEMSFSKLEKEIDYLFEHRNSEVDFIVCSFGVKRAYQEYLIKNKINMDIIALKDGWKAISHNGIPIVQDRNCPEGTMYLLNTKHFTINELCDWCWVQDNYGVILRQKPDEPKHTATLVKYANMICANPAAQGILTGIVEYK